MPISLSTFRNKTIAGGLASLLLLTGTAMAHHQTTESFSVDGAIESAPSTGSFSLSDFDSSLGTLQWVTLTLNLNATSTVQVYNLSSSPEDFQNASLSELGTITGPGLVLNSSINATLASGTAQPGLNSFSLDPMSQSKTGKADKSSLALWVDQPGGMVDFTFTKGNPTFGGTDVGGENLLFGGSLIGTGDVTVKYTYLTSCPPLTTPEPAGTYFTVLVAVAMALLALGRFRTLRC